MRVHAIETGKVITSQRQLEGVGGGRTRPLRTTLDRSWTDPLPILAWLIEHPDGPILVDTGESAGTAQKGWFPWWQPYFRLAVRFQVEPEDEIGPQLRARGFDPDDVKTVVLTHLHGDHVGGVPHFPRSEFVVVRGEYNAAQGFAGEAGGYLPKHLPQWFDPRLIVMDRDPYAGFEASCVIADGVTVVATPGHTPHHVSVIVEDGDRTLFLAGDASYREDLMRAGTTDGVTTSPKAHADTLRRIREFVDGRGAVFLPAHDPESVARLEAAS